MKLKKWRSNDEYRKAQIETHDKKRDAIWVRPEEIVIIASILTKHFSDETCLTGICHGVRTGAEVDQLTQLLNLNSGDIIGTDIAADPKKCTYIYRHDFHDRREEWYQTFDFVYTNALDHAHDPHLALRVWTEQLRPNGLMLLHWGKDHNGRADTADCFAASFDEYQQIVQEAGLQCIDEVKIAIKGKGRRRRKRIKHRRILVGKKEK